MLREMTLDDARAAVAARHLFNLGEVVDALRALDASLPTAGTALFHVTVCALVLNNGQVAVGTATTASRSSLDLAAGAEQADEEALQQALQLMDYAPDRPS